MPSNLFSFLHVTTATNTFCVKRECNHGFAPLKCDFEKNKAAVGVFYNVVQLSFAQKAKIEDWASFPLIFDLNIVFLIYNQEQNVSPANGLLTTVLSSSIHELSWKINFPFFFSVIFLVSPSLLVSSKK